MDVETNPLVPHTIEIVVGFISLALLLGVLYGIVVVVRAILDRDHRGNCARCAL